MATPPSQRLTLAQFLTVPIFAAVALACIAFAVRSRAVELYGLVPVILLEAIAVPLAMTAVSLVVLRQGPARHRLVALLLGVAVLSAMLTLLILEALTIWDIGRSVANGLGVPIDLVAFAIFTGGGLLGLNAAFWALMPRIKRNRCASCGRTTATNDHDGGIDDQHSGDSPRVCEDCAVLAESNPDVECHRPTSDDTTSGSGTWLLSERL